MCKRGRSGKLTARVASVFWILVFWGWMPALGNPSGTSPKQVLLLHSFGREFAPFNTFTEGFRTELGQRLEDEVEFHDVGFENARYDTGGSEAPIVNYLKALFSSHRLDLVVTVGGPAARFVLKRRSDLFPETPLLFTALDQRHLQDQLLGTKDAVVGIANNPGAILENILTVLPETTNVAVVLGSSPIEKFWANEMQRELAPFTNRVALTWLTQLTFSQLQARVAALPPRSALYYAFFTMDAAGIPCVEERALPQLHRVANAPLFGVFDTQLGLGIVGGPLISVDASSRRAAQAAEQLLRGRDGREAARPPQVPEAPIFDWRELKRWGIREAQLPPGSQVRFRPPSIWEENRGQIVGVATVLLAQTALIILLAIQHTRKRQAEANALHLGRRLVNAHEEERIRIARELHDDITQRMAVLALDAGGGLQPAVNRHLKDSLAQLSEDIHALSHRLHPSVLGDLGLGEALRMECERVAGRSTLNVTVSIAEGCRRPPAETALCLFRVAQEALRNTLRHAQARVVRLSLRRLEGGLQLIVADDGVGFDAAQSRGLPSLGLQSMKERVQLLGGTLEIDSAPGRGTTVLAWVPEKPSKSK